MAKKIILALGTFLIVMGGLLTYRQYAATRDVSAPTLPGGDQSTGEPTGGFGATAVGPVDRIKLVMVNEVDEREGYAECKRFELRGGTTYVMEQPYFEMYESSGEVVSISADEAIVLADMVVAKINVHRGTIRGNVKITVDRGRGPMSRRPPREERPGDFIDIFVDELRFDRSMLEIVSDSQVTVESQEADIIGTGLVLTWNTGPQELRELRLKQGKELRIKQGQEQFRSSLFEPSASAGGASAAEGRPEPPRAAVPTDPGKKPTMYRLTLNDNVQVASGQQTLEGVKTLTLEFQAQSDRIIADQPVTAATGPDADEPGQEAQTQPTSQPEPMVITWTGPLVLTPIKDNPPALAPGQFILTVTGDESGIRMSDEQLVAECTSFSFNSLARTGTITGSPVRVMLADGALIECPRIDFDRDARQAVLSGAGKIVGAGGEMDLLAGSAGPDGPVVVSGGENERLQQRVQWDGAGLVRFDKLPEPDPQGQDRWYIQFAQFSGRVRTDEGRGDFVEADEVELYMDVAADGEPAPTRAVARGHVEAQQQGYHFFAGSLEIGFRKPSADEIAGGETRRVVVGKVWADNGFEAFDTSPSAPWHAWGTRMGLNPATGVAVLSGKPVRVMRQDQVVETTDITLSRRGQRLVSHSIGRITFPSTNSLFGPADEPRQVRIEWGRDLTFDRATDNVLIRGDVLLSSGEHEMLCGELDVDLVGEAIGTSLTATGQTPGAETIRRMEARDNVVVRSLTTDPDGLWEQMVRLRGDKLVYTAAKGLVEMPGKGDLLVADFRSPSPADVERIRLAVKDDPLSAMDITRPHFTLFTFAKGLRVVESYGVAEMWGDVNMMHQSGDFVKVPANWPVAAFPRIGTGHDATLQAQQLLANFRRPDGSSDDEQSDDSGVPLAALKSIYAIGDVVLRDGRNLATCYEFTYDMEAQTGRLLGDPEGAGQKLASLRYVSTGGGLGFVEAAKIIWDAKKRSAEGFKTTGLGGQ